MNKYDQASSHFLQAHVETTSSGTQFKQMYSKNAVVEMTLHDVAPQRWEVVVVESLPAEVGICFCGKLDPPGCYNYKYKCVN